jgi:hypothetical protein
MGNPVIVPVTQIQQLPGLCGAASAQMILHARGVIGTSQPEQLAVWADIKNNTPRPGKNPGGRKCTGCLPFPNQICEACKGGCAQCWCTHPAGLARTITARLNGHRPTFQYLVGDEQEMVSVAFDKIDNGIASAMLIYGMQHWVVIHGYTPDEGGRAFGSHRVSLIHVHNPMWATPQEAIAIGDWMDYYMTTVQCGDFEGKCVMVTQGAAA